MTQLANGVKNPAAAGNGLVAQVVKKAALGGGITAGALIAYSAWSLVEQRPDQVLALVRDVGGYFLVLVTLLYIGDRRLAQMAGSIEKTAVAMSLAAGAVDRVATKDYLREQERELLLDHLNTTNSQILREMSGLREMLIGISGGRA